MHQRNFIPAARGVNCRLDTPALEHLELVVSMKLWLICVSGIGTRLQFEVQFNLDATVKYSSILYSSTFEIQF